jgi:ABC-type glycerol-3-phosphate transport system permease component
MSDAPSATLTGRGRWPVFIVLTLVALTILYPLFFIIVTSLRPNPDYLANPFGMPAQWTFDNYQQLLDVYGVGRAFVNSVLVSTISVVLVITLATIAGYALAKLPVPGQKWISAIFISVMLVPGPVLIIPVYLLLSRLGLVGGYAGLILVYVAGGLPFGVFFLSLSFRAIPDEVIESARIDGAGFLRTVWSIILPMGASAIATLAVLQFLAVWNELIFAFILVSDQSMRLLTPTLATIGTRYLNDQPLVSAGLLITSLVPLLMLALASKYVMRGLSGGVGK